MLPLSLSLVVFAASVVPSAMMLRDSASYLFDVTRRYNIDAEGEQAGWVQPVHSPGRIKIAAQVPEFDPAKYIEPELLPYCDPFTQFSIVAADEAVERTGEPMLVTNSRGSHVIEIDDRPALDEMRADSRALLQSLAGGSSHRLSQVAPPAASTAITLRMSCMGWSPSGATARRAPPSGLFPGPSKEGVAVGQVREPHDAVRFVDHGVNMLGIGGLAKKVFGTPNDRKVKSVRSLVAQVNALEPEFLALSDDEIIARTRTLQKRVQEGGESLDDVLPEAFANCREAARRVARSCYPHGPARGHRVGDGAGDREVVAVPASSLGGDSGADNDGSHDPAIHTSQSSLGINPPNPPLDSTAIKSPLRALLATSKTPCSTVSITFADLPFCWRSPTSCSLENWSSEAIRV